MSYGRNVTAEPPRTQLWCLLYAQARQADNLDSRNILLDDKQLDELRNVWLKETNPAKRKVALDAIHARAFEALPYISVGQYSPAYAARKEVKGSEKLWGGLPLTLLLTAAGMAGALPLGIALAYGRRSRLPVLRGLIGAAVELARGVGQLWGVGADSPG